MKLSAHLDLDVVALEQSDELTLLVELTAPSPAGTAPRAPAALQVVLDRSGSMAGDRLEGAKHALLALVDRLDPTDAFGLVAFDDDVQVVVPAGALSDKHAVKHAIAGIHPGGCTDLSAGYLRGLQEAQRVAGASGATLLLISDGHANAGVTDPGQLGQVAAQAHGKNVTTTTLGFGLGYDERLLDALAKGGQGVNLFAEEADSAGALIAEQVDGLLDKVAQAASMHIRMTPHVQALAVLNDLPVQTVGGGVTVELGSFYAAETRKLVLRFRVPGIAALGLCEIATLQLTHVSLPDLLQHVTELPVHVNVVPGDQAAGRIPDPVVRSEALFQDAQKSKREASRLMSEQRYGEASQMLNSTADALRVGLAMLPEACVSELVEEVGTVTGLAREVQAGYGERAAKASSYDAARKSRNRGRANTGGTVVLRRADGADTYLLDDWRLDALRRAVEDAGGSWRGRGRNSPRAAAVIAAGLPDGDALRAFLEGAAQHGGFAVETP
jgi:Ca-activated chloride channel homolog